MSILVIANDVIPGFGVPVAAPGIRAAGLAAGLRSHGFDVEVSVPETIIKMVCDPAAPVIPPPGATVVDPTDLHEFIVANSFDTVVFTNANMAPHLHPVQGTRFVFDMFAPKILELLSSGRTDRDWVREARRKERALALADHVWVNGRRKLGYALGWLLRPSVDRIRTDDLGLGRLIDGDPMKHVSVVEMPVPLPQDTSVRALRAADGVLRVGVAGYVQRWSALDEIPAAYTAAIDTGHELHVLQPEHWGGSAPDEAPVDDPPGVHRHQGPLGYGEFAAWIQSMDVMVDVFAQSAERHMAMITRSAVALRFGVPVMHGVDSEISDLVHEYDAGWVIDSNNDDAWRVAFAECADADILARKQTGARRISEDRFAPDAALAEAASKLQAMPR